MRWGLEEPKRFPDPQAVGGRGKVEIKEEREKGERERKKVFEGVGGKRRGSRAPTEVFKSRCLCHLI